MLFNSYPFLFAFLPAVLAGFYALGRLGRPGLNVAFLALASLAFYAYWRVADLPVLLASIAANYLVGQRIAASEDEAGRRRWLFLGVFMNLVALGWFKYTGFLVQTWNLAFGAAVLAPPLVLPLGISFFTFTQTAYLIDLARRETRGHGLRSYLLFVTVFPHLIAGPILHHKATIPQFEDPGFLGFDAERMARGLALFTIGLAKKVLLADHLAPWVGYAFANAGDLTPLDAWCAAVGYALQLYFDFSGYSDMALGLGLMLNLQLPGNFDSPYQARTIAEFWRRWHMTLSAFLRHYLYIPLGGNRHGPLRHHLNLFVTMLLGGIWHGAGWTFVVWGALHGAYLSIQRVWSGRGTPLPAPLAIALTLLATIVAWVFFRAATVGDALAILRAMADLPGAGAGFRHWFAGWHGVGWLIVLGAVVLGAPNSHALVDRLRPGARWGLAFGSLAILALWNIGNASEFLYFQF